MTLKYGRVVAYQRLKTVERFISAALKVVAFAYKKWWFIRGVDCSAFTGRNLEICTLEKLSLRRSDLLREVVVHVCSKCV